MKKAILLFLIFTMFFAGCDDVKKTLTSERGSIILDTSLINIEPAVDKSITIINSNKFKTIVGKDNDEVIIGDDTFVPQVKLTRWNKEESLIIRYGKNNFDPPILSKNKIRASNHIEEIEFYKADDNNFKIILYLKEKPLDNKFTFYLENWEEFNFYYQPSLEEEWNNPNITDPNDMFDSLEDFIANANRPDDVVHSYAVYHKTKKWDEKGKTNYKTGKAFHIYRPRFIDSDGKWTWADLYIEEGIYTVSIPWDFLNTAKYPIRSNDTIGTTSEGASEADTGQNFIYAGTGGTTSAGAIKDIDDMRIYSRDAAPSHIIELAIYDKTENKVLVANSLETTTVTSDVVAWFTSGNPTGTLAANTAYYVAFALDVSTLYQRYDVASVGDLYVDYGSDATDVFPLDNLSTLSASGWKRSVYATYTTQSAPAAQPVGYGIINVIEY